MKDLKPGTTVAFKAPVQTFVEPNKSYVWCACGQSINQPFCDGTHKRKGDLKPMVFKAEKAGALWLCQCKQTKNPPYCDGTHNTL